MATPVTTVLRSAERAAHGGAVAEAIALYQSVLARFPQNRRARNGLARLKTEGPHIEDWRIASARIMRALADNQPDAALSLVTARREAQANNPPSDEEQASLALMAGVALHGLGRTADACASLTNALAIPDALTPAQRRDAAKFLGAALLAQGRPEAAVEAIDAAIATGAPSASLLNMAGRALQKAGRVVDAAARFAEAAEQDPSHVEARANGAGALAALGRLDEADTLARSAIALAPDHPAPHVALARIDAVAGRLARSAAAAAAALRRDPVNNEAKRLLLEAAAQTPPALDALPPTPLDAPTPAHPMIYALDLLCNYLSGSLTRCARLAADRDRVITQAALAPLGAANAHFSEAYALFIAKLIEATPPLGQEPPLDQEPPPDAEAAPIYHLGESHCLSFAHRSLFLDGERRRIAPRIVIGAKAFHLGRGSLDRRQAIFRAHAAMLPARADALLSFGEIDCRATEGILHHVRASGRPVAQVAAETAERYVAFADETLRARAARLWFLTVPAPVIGAASGDDAARRIEAVRAFNGALQETARACGHGVIDTYAASAGDDGSAHGGLHLDTVHLGPAALPALQAALDAG